MAEVIPIGKPANEAERLGLRLLRDRLPDHYVILGNFDLLLPRRKRSLEFDAVVIGEYGFFAVEIKGWSGRITANDQHWMVPWGRVTSPLAHLQKKTKALAHHFRSAVPHLYSQMYYAPAIFFPRGDVYLDCGAAVRDYIITPEGLYDFFVNEKEIRARGPGPLRTKELIREVVDAIIERAEPSLMAMQIPYYEVEAEIEAKCRPYREFVGRHKFLTNRSKVRIKAYTLDWLASKGSLQEEQHRFLRELEALDSLEKSPYVVRSYDMLPNIDEEMGFFAISEWVGPLTLEIYLETLEERPLEEREFLAHHLVKAIQSIHDAQTIHRNLSPAAIYLVEGFAERREEIPLKIADFDYARMAEMESIADGLTNIGTLRYQAPELRIASEHGPEVDLFSLGLILFELFTGRAFFESLDGIEDPLSVDLSFATARKLLEGHPWEKIIFGLLHSEKEYRFEAMESVLPKFSSKEKRRGKESLYKNYGD